MTWCKAITRITGKLVELNVLLQSGVFFGLVTDLGCPQDTAQRFLSSVHSEMVKLYNNNINFIHRQQKLTLHVSDKVLMANFTKVLESETGITSTNLNLAQQKVYEVKKIAG